MSCAAAVEGTKDYCKLLSKERKRRGSKEWTGEEEAASEACKLWLEPARLAVAEPFLAGKDGIHSLDRLAKNSKREVKEY